MSDYSNRRIRRRADILSEEIDEETVLFDPRNKNTYALNPMASVIWQLCDGNRTPSEISAEISGVLDVDSDRVLADVLSTIGSLIDRNLVEIV